MRLEMLTLDGLPEAAVPVFEAALATVCLSVGLFREEATDTWRLEGVAAAGADAGSALALAAAVAGIDPSLVRAPVEAEGWLARTLEGFPEQPIGRRFLVRPTHLPNPREYARIVLRLDAGVAFGSGEHASTRGCLLALERIAHRRPRCVLDLGTGSGILAIAAARTCRAHALATDIDDWSVRAAADNTRRNGVAKLVRTRTADGWRDRVVRAGRYDLVFANILARPLCAMARDLARHLRPGGVAILSGLLATQARWVLAAHRRAGLVLLRRHAVGAWATLVVRRPAPRP